MRKKRARPGRPFDSESRWIRALLQARESQFGFIVKWEKTFRHAKLDPMEVILRIPDDVAERLALAGGDVSRRALEALALEGYREQALTLYQVSEMLGLSRVEAEDFLGRHHVPLAAIGNADLDREAVLFEAASRRKTR